MKSIELAARAKVNLSLDVINKRPDGYHDLRMVMQTIRLHDKVILEVIESGIEISCNCRWVPSSSDNIAFKAADLFINTFGIRKGVRIKIDKRIPVAAGLAGGSSDAAAVLKGMRSLFLPAVLDEELMTLGRQVGADVPYCIKGGTMLAEGIGDILTELVPFTGVNMVLIKPRIGVSTAWVYKSLEIDKIVDRPDTELITRSINNSDIFSLAKNMRNVMETVTEKKYDIIREIKSRLIERGAIGSVMSGSGPTVFGIFRNYEDARKAALALRSSRWDSFLTETV